MGLETGAERKKAQRLFLYVAGIVTMQGMIVIQELTAQSLLHSSIPYLAVSCVVPIVMATAYWATGQRFAATLLAAFYVASMIGLILVLPLFPAQPKLGPVYQPVTHFIPPQFPLLLLAPALLLDLLWQRTGDWGAWKQALTSAFLFVGTLLAVEWPFAAFLMSPASRNRFFGTTYFPYFYLPQSDAVRFVFSHVQNTHQFWLGLALALCAATLTFRLGITLGEWMKDLRR
jgi:hypothetical protein